MYRKVAVLIVAVFVVGSAALVLRQRQLQYAHAITQTHRRIDETRQSIWMMQSLVAQQLQPSRLRRDVETKLAVVEPLAPLAQPPGEPARLAAAPDARKRGVRER